MKKGRASRSAPSAEAARDQAGNDEKAIAHSRQKSAAEGHAHQERQADRTLLRQAEIGKQSDRQKNRRTDVGREEDGRQGDAGQGDIGNPIQPTISRLTKRFSRSSSGQAAVAM